MGANAVTTVPVYVAGEVLTAADLNITNSGIPVFADSTARDAAFGGTGEKVLAEGQYAFLEDTNATQFYDGATWQPVGVAPGLVFVAGASFSAVTSFSLPTSTFSSTYANYKIIIHIPTLSADSAFTMRMRNAGTDTTSAIYYSTLIGVNSVASTKTIAADAQTSMNFYNGDQTVGDYLASFDIAGPNLASITLFAGGIGGVDTTQNDVVNFSGGYRVNDAVQYDSLSFISSTASSMTGTYRVYGYANS
jgi:hypothetical protein